MNLGEKDARKTDLINLIYITLYYPPLGNSGTIRNAQITKYMLDYGINPIIVTSNALLVNNPKDYTIVTDKKNKLLIYRMNVIDLSWIYKVLWGLRLGKAVKFIQNYIIFPDQFILWKYTLRVFVLKLVKKHNAQGIYISVGPFSTLSIIDYIKSRVSIPIFIDFRDEWTNNPFRHFSNIPISRQTREEKNELKALTMCSGIVFNNESMKRNFTHKYNFLDSKPNLVVYNGFDISDFDHVTINDVNKLPDRLNIVYTGAFYDHQNPRLIWEALDKLSEEGKIDLSKICIQIFGKNNADFIYRKVSDNTKLRRAIQIYSYLSHEEAIKRMLSADLLLLFIAGGVNSESVLTTKLFEYLKSGKPIWAIVPLNGEAANIIRNSNAGWVASSDSVDKISDSFLNIYELWQDENLQLKLNEEFIDTFSRDNQVKALSTYIKSQLSY